MVESSNLRVRQVYDIKEIQENHGANYLEWGRGLTKEQYLAREQHLGSQPPCQNKNISYWRLEILDEATGEWKMASSCETLNRPAFYKVKGKPVQETTSISIGAVFTPEEYRGKGYARKLLNHVIEQFDIKDGDFKHHFESLNDEQFQNSFSVLWSDVGHYYDSFGYKLSTNLELVIPLTSEPIKEKLDSKIEWFTEDDVAKFSDADQKQFMDDLDHLTEQDGIPRAVIKPSKEVHQMTHARAHFVAPLLRSHLVDKKPEEITKKIKTVEYFGAKCGPVQMLWTQDIGNNKLNVIRVMVDSQVRDSIAPKQVLESIVALLEAAAHDAKKWELSKITMWAQDLPFKPKLSLQEVRDAWNAKHGDTESGKLSDREDSWPMMRPHGGRKEDGKVQQQLVFDGKYAWY